MGGKQLGFSDYDLTTTKKLTKRERLLSEMEAIVPWRALIELISQRSACRWLTRSRSEGPACWRIGAASAPPARR
jgi:hypothetical protein